MSVTLAPPDSRTVSTEIHTERLLLRALQPGDGGAVFAAIEASRDHLRLFSPVPARARCMADAERLVRLAWANWLEGREYRMGLWMPDGYFLGMIALHHGEWSVPRFELGCWIHIDHAGRGYATEVTRAMIAFAFDTLGINRLDIRCDHRNQASRHVAAKLGFTLEGQMRAHNRAIDGALVDEMVFTLLKPEEGGSTD